MKLPSQHLLRFGNICDAMQITAQSFLHEFSKSSILSHMHGGTSIPAPARLRVSTTATDSANSGVHWNNCLWSLDPPLHSDLLLPTSPQDASWALLQSTICPIYCTLGWGKREQVTVNDFKWSHHRSSSAGGYLPFLGLSWLWPWPLPFEFLSPEESMVTAVESPLQIAILFSVSLFGVAACNNSSSWFSNSNSSSSPLPCAWPPCEWPWPVEKNILHLKQLLLSLDHAYFICWITESPHFKNPKVKVLHYHFSPTFPPWLLICVTNKTCFLPSIISAVLISRAYKSVD
jgi:hypothetical protein